jgi:hypothetical protein
MPVFPVPLVLCGHTQPRVGDPPPRRTTVPSPVPRTLAAWALLLLLAPACKDDGTQPASMPPAEAYETPSSFAGEWLGEVEGQVGTLTITPLGAGRYRGRYEGEDVEIDYVLLLEQDLVPVGSDTIPGNRAVFTWQDGRGGRGEGWLLVNREDSALTGAFGERGLLERPWTFIRVE